MDFVQLLIGAVGAVFGAGTTYGVVQTRINRLDSDLLSHKQSTDSKLDAIDKKIDNITNHLIELARQANRHQPHG